jgi:type IX secretion system PorP/SprF family membrane protein
MVRTLLLGMWLATLAFGSNIANAQRYFRTNPYPYDLFLVNPAAGAINKDCFSINGYFQKQWLGTALAPTTQMLTYQNALPNNLGIGTFVYNDRNGNNREVGLQQTFAYRVTVSKTKRRTSHLLFGLSVMGEQRSIDIGNLNYDPSFDQSSGFGYNANTGMIVTVNDWQFGVSATNILPYNNTMLSSEEEPPVTMDINIHIGTAFKVPNRNLYFEPLIYYRTDNKSSSRSDINLKVTMPAINPLYTFWGMAAYRRTMDEQWGKGLAVAGTAGVMVGHYKVGLEYQFGLTRAQIDFGSSYHFVLGYKFCRNRKNMAIPCSKDETKLKVGL